jgi:hypothetical protein
VLGQLSGNPVFNLALTAEVKRLQKEHPNEIKGMKPEELVSVAGFNLVESHGSTSGLEFKANADAFMRQNQLRHQSVMEANAARQTQLSALRTQNALQNSAERRAKKENDELDTIPGIFRQYQQGNPQAAQLVESNKTVFRLGNMPIPSIDLTTMAGVPVVTDPETGRKAKLFLGSDPQFGTGLIIQYQKKKTIRVGKEEKPDPSGGYEPDGVKIISSNINWPGMKNVVKDDPYKHLSHFFPALSKKRKADGADDPNTFDLD